MIYLKLFWIFCRIGAVTFGGGYAMISLIKEEVIRHNWCSAEEFANLAAISQMTPGPIALNTATYVGKIIAGIPGAVIASFGLIFPALCLTTITVLFFDKMRQSEKALPFIRGIRAAAIGLIGAALLFFMENSLFSGELPLNISLRQTDKISEIKILWQGLIIFVPVFLLCLFKNLKPWLAILLSLCGGICIYTLFPL